MSLDNRFTRSKAGRSILRVLEPSRWWIILFAAALIVVVVWTLTIYRDEAKDQARLAASQAVHQAEIKEQRDRVVANADSQYRQCVASIRTYRKINGFIQGQSIIAGALVSNATANVEATPTTSSQYLTKVRNLQRLIVAKDASKQVQFPVPVAKATPASDRAGRPACDVLRKQLLQTSAPAPGKKPKPRR